MYIYFSVYIYRGGQKYPDDGFFKFFFHDKLNTPFIGPFQMLFNDTKISKNGSVLIKKSQKNMFFGLKFLLKKMQRIFFVFRRFLEGDEICG